MCYAHKKGIKLYGIGIGPGDPNLLTLRAKQILDRVNIIFVPKASQNGGSFARSIIEDVIYKPKRFVELTFPMIRDKKILRVYWLRAARKIAKELKTYKEGAFVTIGDPFIYSTYIYLLGTLRKNFPTIDVETIPGISSFSAAASYAQVPLVKGDEKLAILPVTRDLRCLRDALKVFDTVVLMKVGSKLDKVMGLLEEMNLIKNSVFVSHVGQPNEKILYDISPLKGRRREYLSLIIVRPKI